MTYTCITIVNGRSQKAVIRKTHKGIFNYVHSMFARFGKDTRVNVGYIDDKLNFVTVLMYAE